MGLYYTSEETSHPSSPPVSSAVLYPRDDTRWYYKTPAGVVKTVATLEDSIGSFAGLGSGVATALGVSVGSAGAFVVNGGALGTPSSGTLTSCTGLPFDGVTAPTGNFTISMGNKNIKFNFTNPGPTGAYDGAWEIEGTGNFSGDLIHVHQLTGTVSVGTDVVHIEATHANATALHLIHAGSGAALSVTQGTTTLQATTLEAALTYGGVTLTNAVTGTGKMVLDTAPTVSNLAGTLNAPTGSLGAITLGGAVTGNGQNITGVGTFSAGTSNLGATGSLNVITGPYTGMLKLQRDADINQYMVFGTGGGESFINSYATAGSIRYPLIIRNTNNSSTVDYVTFSATALTLGSGITSISGGTNPSLNIGTGALTAGAANFSGDLAIATNKFNVASATGNITSSGHFALGSLPATLTTLSQMFAGGNLLLAAQSAAGGEGDIVQNGYYNSGWKYRYAAVAQRISLNETSGEIGFHVAGAGSADAAITWAKKATIDTNGINGAIGGTTPAAGSFTTGTFSGLVSVGPGGTGTSNGAINIEGSSGVDRGALVNFKRNNVSKGYIGTSSAVLGGTSDDIVIANGLNVALATFTSAGINGALGGTTPAAATVTTLTASATAATAGVFSRTTNGDVITFASTAASGKTGYLYADNAYVGLFTATGATGSGVFASATHLYGQVGGSTITDQSATGLAVTGTLKITSLGSFTAGDKYVIADASGNFHISALGPAS